jgi:hypothetical protein
MPVMIVPTAGPMDYPRDVGQDRPPGGADLPQPLQVSHADMMHCLNPLQYVPVVGMIYRAVTGEHIPSTVQVAAAGITGGPLGMIASAFTMLFEELIKMGPDTSRPAAPAGMSVTGSEQGVQPVTPGTLSNGAYTTLATTVPDFLRSAPDVAVAQNTAVQGAAAYKTAMSDYQRSQWVEKGLS